MDDDLLMTHEAAKILGVSRERVLQFTKAGRLGRTVKGRLPPALVSREEVEADKPRPTRQAGRPTGNARAQQQPARDAPERAPAANPPAPQERGDIWFNRRQELMVAGRRRSGG